MTIEEAARFVAADIKACEDGRLHPRPGENYIKIPLLLFLTLLKDTDKLRVALENQKEVKA